MNVTKIESKVTSALSQMMFSKGYKSLPYTKPDAVIEMAPVVRVERTPYFNPTTCIPFQTKKPSSAVGNNIDFRFG